jgi:hypothetical protein
MAKLTKVKETPRPLAICVWDDAHGTVNQDIDPDNIPDHKPIVMTTLGWLLRDDEKGVFLAMERFMDDDGRTKYRGTTFVPRGMVKSLTLFTLAKSRVRKEKPANLEPEPLVGPEPKKSNSRPQWRVL